MNDLLQSLRAAVGARQVLTHEDPATDLALLRLAAQRLAKACTSLRRLSSTI